MFQYRSGVPITWSIRDCMVLYDGMLYHLDNQVNAINLTVPEGEEFVVDTLRDMPTNLANPMKCSFLTRDETPGKIAQKT